MKTGKFFEINVSQNGKHIFATDCYNRQYSEVKINELIKLFKEKFPEEEKYVISVTSWNVNGNLENVENLN